MVSFSPPASRKASPKQNAVELELPSAPPGLGGDQLLDDSPRVACVRRRASSMLTEGVDVVVMKGVQIQDASAAATAVQQQIKRLGHRCASVVPHFDGKQGYFRGTVFVRFHAPAEAQRFVTEQAGCFVVNSRRVRVELQRKGRRERAQSAKDMLEADPTLETQRVRKLLQDFMNSEEMDTYLPADLDPEQRKYAHALAEKQGLSHTTTDAPSDAPGGAGKRVWLAKYRVASSNTGSSRSNSFYHGGTRSSYGSHSGSSWSYGSNYSSMKSSTGSPKNQRLSADAAPFSPSRPTGFNSAAAEKLVAASSFEALLLPSAAMDTTRSSGGSVGFSPTNQVLPFEVTDQVMRDRTPQKSGEYSSSPNFDFSSVISAATSSGGDGLAALESLAQLHSSQAKMHADAAQAAAAAITEARMQLGLLKGKSGRMEDDGSPASSTTTNDWLTMMAPAAAPSSSGKGLLPNPTTGVNATWSPSVRGGQGVGRGGAKTPTAFPRDSKWGVDSAQFFSAGYSPKANYSRKLMLNASAREFKPANAEGSSPKNSKTATSPRSAAPVVAAMSPKGQHVCAAALGRINTMKLQQT